MTKIIFRPQPKPSTQPTPIQPIEYELEVYANPVPWNQGATVNMFFMADEPPTCDTMKVYTVDAQGNPQTQILEATAPDFNFESGGNATAVNAYNGVDETFAYYYLNGELVAQGQITIDSFE